MVKELERGKTDLLDYLLRQGVNQWNLGLLALNPNRLVVASHSATLGRHTRAGAVELERLVGGAAAAATE